MITRKSVTDWASARPPLKSDQAQRTDVFAGSARELGPGSANVQ
jgi:hypothetical protein